ncbi:MAG: hypothetical protein DCC67_13220 [Planctomycetota bacterium]|nr:MAG: hypothetical protein DCC67_13220 [Planctomycetota bacterium]
MTKPSLRDRQILDHVARYRLSTREFIQRHFFAEAGKSAVSKVVGRLVADGYLRVCRLANGFHYYVVGQQGREFTDAASDADRPFTEQSFPLAYGFLAFCSAHGVRRLTSSEFQTTFPELCRPRMKTGSFYADARHTPARLGTVLVDRGNPPKLIIRKLQRLLAQHYRLPNFAQRIQAGQFCVTILTAWPLKQRLLASAVKLGFRAALPVEVVTVPELQLFYRRV